MMERTHGGVWVDADDPPPPSSSSALWQQASVMDIDDEPFVTGATQTKQRVR